MAAQHYVAVKKNQTTPDVPASTTRINNHDAHLNSPPGFKVFD